MYIDLPALCLIMGMALFVVLIIRLEYVCSSYKS